MRLQMGNERPDSPPAFDFEVMSMKRLQYKNGRLDPTDALIVEALSSDGRLSTAALARRIGLSSPSTGERVKRLEEAGVVEGYAARVNPVAFGYALSAWLRIRPVPGQLARVGAILDSIHAITECHRVTGDDCFVARVHLRSIKELEEVLDRLLPFAMTNTSIIQSTTIAPRLPPLPGAPPAPRGAARASKGRRRAARR